MRNSLLLCLFLAAGCSAPPPSSEPPLSDASDPPTLIDCLVPRDQALLVEDPEEEPSVSMPRDEPEPVVKKVEPVVKKEEPVVNKEEPPPPPDPRVVDLDAPQEEEPLPPPPKIGLLGVRFFEAGWSCPSEKEQQYNLEFPRATTRYVWVKADFFNQLHKVENRTYEVAFKFKKPDGTPAGESSGTFGVDADWRVAWHARSWGWGTPGRWSPGTYRVEIWVSRRKVGEEAFTILEDPQPEPHTEPEDVLPPD